MYDLYIFDKDQTLTNPFEAWADASINAIKNVSDTRAVARGYCEEAFLDTVYQHYNRKREITANTDEPFKVYTWYWHFDKFIDGLNILKPQNHFEKNLFAEEDQKICAQYTKERREGVKAFGGVNEVLDELQKQAPLCLFTDARVSEIGYAFDITNINMTPFSAISCQIDERGEGYDLGFKGDLYHFDGKKPKEASIKCATEMINCFRNNKTGMKVAIIGDNKTDAGVYKALSETFSQDDITFDFMWAKYGADLSEKAVTFANVTINDPYRFGVDENKKGILSLGVTPKYILEKPTDIFNCQP